MTTQEVKRKLAAILSADVEGYSRLMGEDEVGTIRTLNAYMEVITGFIQQHRGRVVSTGGDSVLAEFGSVVDAVQCAVEIQKELKTRNSELPENRRMEFRIGINLGDVVEDGEQILGDGVNIAARLESLSEAEGICISGTTFDQVKNKLNLGYNYLGKRAVKNIAEPIRVYRVLMEPERVGKVIGERKAKPRKKMAFPLPDKPSIAVLPFLNMSRDPEQEYFGDGIAEEIIIALTKSPKLFVIAHNSTSFYKGKPVSIKQVAEEMGVQYILEGSFRKTGDKVRITAQLIDALTGRHIWAERYDGDLKDIFAVQDEITIKITSALNVKLTDGEIARMLGKSTKNLEAYLKLIHARELMLEMNKENIALSRKLIEEVIALDPGCAMAYGLMASIYTFDVLFGTSQSSGESTDKGIEMARKSIALDKNLAWPHGVLTYLYRFKKDYGKALSEGETAVALEPNSALSYMFLGHGLHFSSRYDEAIAAYEKAIRLSPFPQSAVLINLGVCLRSTGRYEESVAVFKKLLQEWPDHIFAHLQLAATYNMMGRDNESRAHVKEALRIDPNFSVDSYSKMGLYKNKDDWNRYMDALRKVGLK